MQIYIFFKLKKTTNSKTEIQEEKNINCSHETKYTNEDIENFNNSTVDIPEVQLIIPV